MAKPCHVGLSSASEHHGNTCNCKDAGRRDAIASRHQPPCRGCGVKHVVRNIFCPHMPQRLSWWENPLWKQSRWECMLRCSSTPVVFFSRDDIKQVVLSVRHHSSLCLLQFLLLAFSPRAFSCYSANTLPLLCPMSVWRPCQIKLKLFGDFPRTPGVLQRSAAPERQKKKTGLRPVGLRKEKLVEMWHEQQSFDVDFLVCASRVKSDAAKCAKLSNWLAIREKPQKLITAGNAHSLQK